jgi:hypothetical protein
MVYRLTFLLFIYESILRILDRRGAGFDSRWRNIHFCPICNYEYFFFGSFSLSLCLLDLLLLLGTTKNFIFVMTHETLSGEPDLDRDSAPPHFVIFCSVLPANTRKTNSTLGLNIVK